MILISFQFIYKESLGRKWLKVFHHYSGSGEYFNSESEVSFINSTNKFSILGMINNEYKIENKFEFLLEYPQISGYNHWNQSINPLLDLEVPSQQATGYNPISITWSQSSWGGLVKSMPGSGTIIDGSAGDGMWYYAIGCTHSSWSSFNFPGPDGLAVNEVNLRIRITKKTQITIKNQKKISCIRNYVFHFYFILINQNDI